MLDFGALPPEINSGRMYVGAGSGPLLAAAAAWDELAAELQSTAASYGSTVQGLTVGPWTGPSSIAMAAAAAPYVAWMSATGASGRTGGHPGQTRRGRLRNGVCRHGAAAGDRGQSQPARGVDRHQLLGPKHPGHRGHRGPIHGDVGPGCRRDVCLCRILGSRVAAHAVHRAATDHQHARARRRKRPRFLNPAPRPARTPPHSCPADHLGAEALQSLATTITTPTRRRREHHLPLPPVPPALTELEHHLRRPSPRAVLPRRG